MRTDEIWHNKVKSKVVEKRFPPRIQNDLQRLDIPANLPEKGTSLYLFGDTDTGKTILASFMLLEYEKELYLNNLPGESLFVNTCDLFNTLKESFENKEITEQSIIKKYQQVPFLVLDDFGTIKPSDWVYQTLYLIINYRYEHLLITIFTSNNDMKKTELMFGDNRITSRIERMCQIKKKTKYKV